MKQIIAVSGRSSAGKDILTRQASEKYHIPMVASYSDRAMRPTEKQGREHTFLSKEEMDNVLQKEHILAFTKINGCRYCVSKELLDSLPGDKIFYIIDPAGIQYFEQTHPEYEMFKLYVTADFEVRKTRAIQRNGDTQTFIDRDNDEAAQFIDYEQSKAYDMVIYNNDKLEFAQKDFNHCIEHLLNKNKITIYNKDDLDIER